MMKFPDWMHCTRQAPYFIDSFDVVQFVAGLKTRANARTYYYRLQTDYPEDFDSATLSGRIRFSGMKRPTPAVDASGASRLIMLLQGKGAANFRRESADLVTRYFAGDQTLHAEIDTMHNTDYAGKEFFVDAVARHKAEVGPDTKVYKGYISQYKTAMGSLKNNVPDPHSYHYAIANDRINCAVTRCNSTDEFKRKRGWDGKSKISARKLMNALEIMLVTTANTGLEHLLETRGGSNFLGTIQEVEDKTRRCAAIWLTDS